MLAGQNWVKRALDSLPPREREVVGCIEALGLDVAGTSQALGISAAAVRVAHHRGLKRLRKNLPAGQDQPPLSAATSRSRSAG